MSIRISHTKRVNNNITGICYYSHSDSLSSDRHVKLMKFIESSSNEQIDLFLSRKFSLTYVSSYVREK